MTNKAIRVLALDPGKASGISIVTWDGTDSTPTVDYSTELQENQCADELNLLLSGDFRHNFDGTFVVACETFTINIKTAKNSQAPYSLEMIGVLKYLCRKHGYNPLEIGFQAPVDAKRMFPNQALKVLGTWHRGGEGHANDSIRHGLLRLVKKGWIPRELLLA